MKNYQALIITIVGLTSTIMTLTGSITNYIKFNGIANEIGFIMISILMMLIGLLMIDYKKIYKSLI